MTHHCPHCRCDLVTSTQALAYIRTQCGRPRLKRHTLHRWFRRGAMQSERPRGTWLTTYDWIDEALMWHRVPLKYGRHREKG